GGLVRRQLRRLRSRSQATSRYRCRSAASDQVPAPGDGVTHVPRKKRPSGRFFLGPDPSRCNEDAKGKNASRTLSPRASIRRHVLLTAHVGDREAALVAVLGGGVD